MERSDFEASLAYKKAKTDSRDYPIDYDLGPSPWNEFKGGLLPNPVENQPGIDPETLTELFDPSMNMSVEAFRTMSNLDLPPTLTNTRIRTRGFTISRLQAVLRPAERRLITEKNKWKKTTRPMTLQEMIGSKASSFHDNSLNAEENRDPRSDTDTILRLPSFTRRAALRTPLPDLYAVYLRKFHAYDASTPLPDNDPDALLKESRAQFNRWFDDTRIIADLKFLTANRPDARIPNIVDDTSETVRYGVGGNYGSFDSELVGAIGSTALNVAGDVAYWVTVGWIVDKIRSSDS